MLTREYALGIQVVKEDYNYCDDLELLSNLLRLGYIESMSGFLVTDDGDKVLTEWKQAQADAMLQARTQNPGDAE